MLITFALVCVVVVAVGCVAGRGVAALFGKSRVNPRARTAASVMGGAAMVPLFFTPVIHAHAAVAMACVILVGALGGLVACITGLWCKRAK